MGRQYGPHRPDDVPETHTVKIYSSNGRKVIREHEMPLDRALVEQRRRLNNLAHAAGRDA